MSSTPDIEQVEPVKEIEPKPVLEIVPKAAPTTAVEHYRKVSTANQLSFIAHNLDNRSVQPGLWGVGIAADQGHQMVIKEYNKVIASGGINDTAARLLDYAAMTCLEDNNTLAVIPLKEYKAVRGVKTINRIREQVNRDLETIKNITISWPRRGKKSPRGKRDWFEIDVYGGTSGIVKGYIFFRLNEDFFKSLPKNQFAYLPPEYYSANPRLNPHAAHFMRIVAEHKRKNPDKPNADIIGVDTLLKASPAFPKYEELNHKRLREIYIDPFERDMDVAASTWTWHYQGERGQEYAGTPRTYQEFIQLNVKITYNKEYPSLQNLIKNREQGRKTKLSRATITKALKQLAELGKRVDRVEAREGK